MEEKNIDSEFLSPRFFARFPGRICAKVFGCSNLDFVKLTKGAPLIPGDVGADIRVLGGEACAEQHAAAAPLPAAPGPERLRPLQNLPCATPNRKTFMIKLINSI